MAARDFKRLSDYVLSRRAQLRESQETFARRGELSVKTLQRIEAGKAVRVQTLGQLDQAARWREGSANTVTLGGEPTPLDEGPSAEHLPAPEDRADDTRLSGALGRILSMSLEDILREAELHDAVEPGAGDEYVRRVMEIWRREWQHHRSADEPRHGPVSGGS